MRWVVEHGPNEYMIYRQKRDKQDFQNFIFMFARRFWLNGLNSFRKWIFRKL